MDFETKLLDKYLRTKCFLEKLWDDYVYYSPVRYKIERVYDFFRYDVPQGIKSLVYWFPVIWQDRTWDHAYVYRILRHKLTQMISDFEKHVNYIGVEKDIKRMKICVELLKRLEENDYVLKEFEKHEEKWGKLKMWFEPTPNNMSRCVFHHEHANTKKEIEQERKEARRAYKASDEKRIADLDLLFRILRKYIERWWI